MASKRIFKKKDSSPLAIYDDITEGLKEVYKKALLPLEKVNQLSRVKHWNIEHLLLYKPELHFL